MGQSTNEIPKKREFKTSEVCQLTDTQPYVLRFWETEFPQLSPRRGRGGQTVYSREDVGLVLRIKQLLDNEEFTIEGARRQLDEEGPGASSADVTARFAPEAPASVRVPEAAFDGGRPATGAFDEDDAVTRSRYEDAIEEIAHLRLKLQEAESGLRRADARAQKAEESADRQRQRAHRASARLEKLLDGLT